MKKRLIALLLLPISLVAQYRESYEDWSNADGEFPKDHGIDFLGMFALVILIIYFGMRIYEWIKHEL